MDRWTDKEVVVHKYNWILFSQKKINEEMLLFVATGLDLEGIMLSETSQPEKDNYCMMSLMHGI